MPSMGSLTACALKYHRFVTLLTLLFAVAGLWAVTTMRREVWPEVDLATVIVEAEYPGATPAQVEALLIHPIEQELRALADLKRVTSLAVEGLARITVELEADVSNPDRLMNDIRRAVDRAEDLPADLPDRPRVRDVNTRRDPVMTVALAGLASEAELHGAAKALETRLLSLPGLGKIERSGWRDREIRVEVDPDRLQRYQVSVDDLRVALQQHNVNVPGGPITRTASRELLLRTSGEFAGPDDVAAVVVRANDAGRGLRVGDVATVAWDFATPLSLVRNDGRRAILLGIVKRPAADAVTLARAVHATVSTFQATAPADLQITVPDDFSHDVARRLRVLMLNGLIGLGLVIIVLCLFLSRQSAIGAALGIPIALGSALALLVALGASLNLMTLFGLIMCLGMLVAENIVIAENIHRHLGEEGDPRAQIVAATGEIGRSVTITALTTIAAFLPLLFVEGIIGKFLRWLPWVVVITLCASLTEALVLLPTHLYYMARGRCPRAPDILRRSDRLSRILPRNLLSPKTPMAARARVVGAMRTVAWFDRLRERYLRRLVWALDHRAVVLVGLTCLLIGSGLLARFGLSFILFPPHGVEFFFVRAEAPVGTSLAGTERLFGPLETIVAALPKDEVVTQVTTIGVIQEEPNDPLVRYGSHLGQIAVYLTPEAQRRRSAEEIIAELREGIGTPDGLTQVTFARVSTGPYVGRPVAIELRGDDTTALAAAAGAVRAELAALPGVIDVRDDTETGKGELRVIVDAAVAMRAGFSVDAVGRTVRTLYAGETATTMRRGDEEIDVVVRYPAALRAMADGILHVPIGNPRGQLTPLTAVAHLEEGMAPSFIRHVDYKRAVTVTADIDAHGLARGHIPSEHREREGGTQQALPVGGATRVPVIAPQQTTPLAVDRQMADRFPALTARFPGVAMRAGGEIEASNESLASTVRAMIVAILLILGVLLATLPTTASVVAVLCTLPLGAVGIVLGFALQGQPLSFLACFGAIGLAGVVVDSSLIVVTLAELLRAQGMSARDAILAACRVRFRPIVLVTVTTVLALLPSAYGIGGNDPLIQPAALAMDWGLAIGTFLALLGVPVVYATLQK